MDAIYSAAAVLAAYLLGSLAFAVIVSKLMGLSDPRTFGSKNPGATNVLRSGNKAAAIATLLLDGVKGFVPVMLVRAYGHRYGMGDGTVAMVGLAAFLGHLYPVFFRYSSLASLVAAVSAPVYYLLGDRMQWYAAKPIAFALFVMAGLLAWRHRENIRRLVEGKESRLGAKKA